MSLDLYILPPLLSLPSISGSCIAALSLCNLSLDKSAFNVIESTDLSIGVPALRDGNTWYRGYTNIKQYLFNRNDVDASLSPSFKADVVAWGSLVEDLGDTLTVLLNYTCLTYAVELTIRIKAELSRRHKTTGLTFPPISTWVSSSN